MLFSPGKIPLLISLFGAHLIRLLRKHRENITGEGIITLDPAYNEQVTFVTMCALNFVSLDHGSGVHRWNIRLKDIFSDLVVRGQLSTFHINLTRVGF